MDRHSAQQRRLADAAGDGDGDNEVFVQVALWDLGQQVRALAMQRDEPRDGLRFTDHLGVRRKLRLLLLAWICPSLRDGGE